jgi:hypothetical protein
MCLARAGEIHGRACIAVDEMTVAAGEYPVGQGQLGVAVPADRAELTGGIPPVSGGELAAPPLLRVAQDLGELGPPSIGDPRPGGDCAACRTRSGSR